MSRSQPTRSLLHRTTRRYDLISTGVIYGRPIDMRLYIRAVCDPSISSPVDATFTTHTVNVYWIQAETNGKCTWIQTDANYKKSFPHSLASPRLFGTSRKLRSVQSYGPFHPSYPSSLPYPSSLSSFCPLFLGGWICICKCLAVN